ncbi:MAG: DUF4412 domain-containing protein [candidate division Zixibacteria bacterium]|nr:DUF4412 domain-containing protein [candidate division Zixibacteria bacterium]NIR62785.1 DUF4412 domain-containing protein [candidate division Zixibacteria bacterium]NIS15888.1 DUF4412 domain-containing protein [candidate division Zixibacteria bacterium]NIS44855.1 DUF4412 domain-containing protein [candidate division Zixibacteria bacterium]NIT52337.1 DUF4412 domain-containing protein [candidate division Zixibacteria bacterium]
MNFVKAKKLAAVLLALSIFLVAASPIIAQDQGKSKSLHVKHEITTTGLPLFGAIVVYNAQDIQGESLSRSTRSSKITMNDSVVSDVVVITITNMDEKKQIYINPKTNTYAEKGFQPSDFEVIDTVADAKGPQMEIKLTGKTKEIDGLKCEEIYFKLDMSSSTGVGEAKVKHYFEGTMWVTNDIPNGELYHNYNSYAQKYFRGSNYSSGGFFDILARLDVDKYNLTRLVDALNGVPVEAAFVAQLPSATGGNVFETKIKLIEHSTGQFEKGHFTAPESEEYKQVPVTEFRSF